MSEQVKELSSSRASSDAAEDAAPMGRASLDEGPLFYASGLDVFKRPVGTKRPDGTTSYSLGFKVCTVSEWLDEDGAKTVAELLSKAEGAS